MANIQSIITRLLNIARETETNNTLVQINYFKERLLYRLSLSRYKGSLILKGGTLIYATHNERRSTRDLDMLAIEMQNTEEAVKQVFREIMLIDKSEEDGVEFDVNTISSEPIMTQNIQHGIRIKCTAKFKGTNTRQSLKIEIAFGDVVTPNPKSIDYPSFLSPIPITVLGYTIESVIAEKFHAMIVLAEANSRMKDFYDVFHLLESNDYSNEVLKQAIAKTFESRETIYLPNPVLFTQEFISNSILVDRWNRFFLEPKNLHPFQDFSTIVHHINDILQPIYEELRDNNEIISL